jgi:hypothetical protein
VNIRISDPHKELAARATLNGSRDDAVEFARAQPVAGSSISVASSERRNIRSAVREAQ